MKRRFLNIRSCLLFVKFFFWEVVFCVLFFHPGFRAKAFERGALRFGVWWDPWNIDAYLVRERAHVYSMELRDPEAAFEV